MPEIFLEFIGNASPWLVPLLVVLAVWGKLNWDTLNNPAKKASFDRAVGWLREDSFGQLYLRFLGGLMDRVGDWIGDRSRLSQASMVGSQSKNLTQRMFGFNPFTAESYEKCLWLAFMYPVLVYLIAWVMGAEGQVGNSSLFSYKNNEPKSYLRGLALIMSLGIGISLWFVFYLQRKKRWLALFGIPLVVIGATSSLYTKNGAIVQSLMFLLIFLEFFITLYLGGWIAGLISDFSFKKAHHGIYGFALITSATFAFVFTVFGGSSVPVVIPVAITGVIAGFVVGTVAIPAVMILITCFVVLGGFSVIGAGIMIGNVIIILHFLQRFNVWFFWSLYSALLIILGVFSLNIITESTYMLFILFWLLLPLINAPLDWLSLGFTRGLLQAVRTGNHSGYRTLIWAAADLVLAFFFLFLITAVLVGVTALSNAAAGKTLVDIGCILNNLQTDMSHPDHWWIYFMLLSTLVPTLFHFALAGGAASLWLPRKWRIQLADGLEEDMHKTFGAWVYLTFTPVVGFILMPLALLGSLWWLLSANGGMFGGWLLGWAITLAEWADPSMTLVCTTG